MALSMVGHVRAADLGLSVVVPNEAGRAATHDIIYEELCAGKILDHSRTVLLDLIESAKREGADSVILGCTELGLILDPDDLPLPGFDSMLIHCNAAVEFALS